jgi:hypothetical protein
LLSQFVEFGRIMLVLDRLVVTAGPLMQSNITTGETTETGIATSVVLSRAGFVAADAEFQAAAQNRSEFAEHAAQTALCRASPPIRGRVQLFLPDLFIAEQNSTTSTIV